MAAANQTKWKFYVFALNMERSTKIVLIVVDLLVNPVASVLDVPGEIILGKIRWIFANENCIRKRFTNMFHQFHKYSQPLCDKQKPEKGTHHANILDGDLTLTCNKAEQCCKKEK